MRIAKVCMLVFAVTTLLLACNAWAQDRPECVTVENEYGFPVPQPPDRGVCFFNMEPGGDHSATMFFVNDGENLVFIWSDGLGENNFSRLDPRLKGKFHAHDGDGVTAHLCSQDTNTCLMDLVYNSLIGTPLPDYWFIGPGELLVNGASPTGVTIWCPAEIRFRGMVAANAGSGDLYQLQAFSTSVKDPHAPDPNSCRGAMTRISIDPID